MLMQSTSHVARVAKRQQSQQLAFNAVRCMATGDRSFKVAVLGAGGGIGQPLSMLLKLSPLVNHLVIHDVRGAPGVAADLSHVNSKAKVTFSEDDAGLKEQLKGCDVVVMPAGVPRKPGMTRDDLFNTNASIVKSLTECVADACPDAKLAIVSNPVNSMVPLASEIYKARGVYKPSKILGVTTLDIVRANTFIAEKAGLVDSIDNVEVPVIGGHAGVTILPVFSKATKAGGELIKLNMSDAEIAALDTRVQDGGTEVVQAKAGAGSATLSMAYAGSRFAISLMRGMNGEKMVECTYVESNACEGIPFFSTPCILGPDGVQENTGIPELSEHEKRRLEELKPELIKNIEKGLSWYAENK
eukprot:Clim_evm15s11 gene=Clim_evmTU15s11